MPRSRTRRRRPPRRSPRSIPAPQAWAVSKQKATRRSGTPRAAMASAMSAISVTLVPNPKPLPAEFSRTSVAASGPSSTSPRIRRTASARRRVPAWTDVSRCEPMWTFTKRASNVGATRSSSVSSAAERSARSGSTPARLTRYEAWMASGAMSSVRSRSRKAGSSSGGAASPLPRRRVVGEDLDRGRPDGTGAVGRLDHAARQGQVEAEPAAVWKHRRIVRCARHGPRHAPRASRP